MNVFGRGVKYLLNYVFYYFLIIFIYLVFLGGGGGDFFDTHGFYPHPHPRLPPTTQDPRQLVILVCCHTRQTEQEK